MAQQFVDVNSTEFTLNGILMDKIYIAFPIGSSSIKVVCAYESRNEILPATAISDIQVGGVTYGTTAELIAVLKYVIYNNENVIQYAEANFLGTFADYASLIAAHPTAEAGEYAFTLENQVPEDGVFEYRWNPVSLAWELEPTPLSVQQQPLNIPTYASAKIQCHYWEGILYDTTTPSTLNIYYPNLALFKPGGWAKRIIDTTGKTEFPTVSSATLLNGDVFKSDVLFDLWCYHDGTGFFYFFTARTAV